MFWGMRRLVRVEGGKRIKQWQARALAIKHYLLDKCIIHPMDNAISFLNSYSLDSDLSGGYRLNNRPTGATHLPQL